MIPSGSVLVDEKGPLLRFCSKGRILLCFRILVTVLSVRKPSKVMRRIALVQMGDDDIILNTELGPPDLWVKTALRTMG